MNKNAPSRNLMIATTVGILLVTTSCASPAESAPAPSSTAAAPPTSSSSPSVTKQASASGLPVKGPANDGRGDYLQTTIADDDPAMTVDPSIVEESATSRFSMEDIASAQKLIIKFLAEEGIDSTLNGNPNDPATIDAWWARNKEKIHPLHADELLASLHSEDENQNFVMRPRFREALYGLAYGPEQAHILTRTIKPKAVRAGEIKGEQALGVQSDVSFSVAALRDGKQSLEKVTAVISYTVSKDESGSWRIIGNNAKFEYTPAFAYAPPS